MFYVTLGAIASASILSSSVPTNATFTTASPVLSVLQLSKTATPFNFTIPNYNGAQIRYTKTSPTTGLFNYYCGDGTFCDAGSKYPLAFVDTYGKKHVALDLFTGDIISVDFTKVPTYSVAFYEGNQNQFNCKVEDTFPYACYYQPTYMSSYIFLNILTGLFFITLFGSVVLLALRNAKKQKVKGGMFE